jgi:hypothetical protein
LLFYGNIVYANAPECCSVHTLPVLFYTTLIGFIYDTERVLCAVRTESLSTFQVTLYP